MLLALAAQSIGAAEPLHIGDALPPLESTTAAGGDVQLPAARAGNPRALVFSFSRAASTDSRLWSEHLDKADSGIVTYRVIVLESVPRLVRGMAVSGIKSGIPQALWDRTLLLYRDEAFWKTRLGVSGDKHAYVMLLDGEGRVRSIGSNSFNDSDFAALMKAYAPGRVAR